MNLQEFVAKLESEKLKIANDKINQVQRNQIKADFMGALATTLASSGVDAIATKEGLVLQVENSDANVFIQIDASVKNLDFDLDGAVLELEESLQAKAKREEEKAQAKAKREAEKIKKSK